VFEIKNSLSEINANIASGEDKHIKRAQERDARFTWYLEDISSVLRDLKIKKSWFRL